QNYPNPFNPITKISYRVSRKSFIVLKVFDIKGKEVSTLVNSIQPIGKYEIEFDGNDLSSGIYFYKISAENFIESKKMILLK
ncbi:MAG: T9SS type A sorting domain-containing protein, partial [Ignavibacteria bacterium]